MAALKRPAGALAALAVLAFTASPAFAATATWTVTMTGAAEAPTPGDTKASGTAKITVDDAANSLCYDLSTTDLAKATMAHVHKGAKGASGPPVATLNTPTGGASKACTTIDAATAKAILAKPSDYYVNVHNEQFPAGAIRAQLAAG